MARLSGILGSMGGFRTPATACAALYLLSASVRAQRPETFAEDPGRRKEAVRAVRERAAQRKAEAREWARRHGVPMRHEEGETVFELMAVEEGRPLFYTTLNANAAISAAADRVRDTAPFNVAGQGVTVGVWDAGLVWTNHQEFGIRVAISNANSYGNYHSTHVGGTLNAAGIAAAARGMAPQARIDSYDWNYNDAEMVAAAAAAPDEPGRIYLSNHSYGILAGWSYFYWTNPYTRQSGYHWWGNLETESTEEYFGQYGYGARDWDEIAYGAPYFLPFKAAGNERNNNPVDGERIFYTKDNGSTWTNTLYDSTIHPLGDGLYKNGYDTVPYYGNAKNIVTVGAVSDAVADGARAPANALAADFTSWGPADDGRIKPDLVANGTELVSCNIVATNSYASRSGTSMATPNACGSAALLVDYYGRRFPGQAMRASTLKGLLIHAADDLGRPGPDYQYGWGLVNTRAAAELLKEYADGNGIALAEAVLDGATPSRSYTGISYGDLPVRATLCWTDPPGPATYAHDSRTPVLVNDLDLKITGPDGTHYPFSLSYADPEAVATATGENHVDNVEQVVIALPRPGTYTITVDHDGTLLGGLQHFSLLVGGLASDGDGDGLPDLWENTYFADPAGAFPAGDADGDGMDNVSEFIGGSDPTNPDSVFGFASAYLLPSAGHPPFVVEWTPLPGRLYRIHWTYSLQYVPFEPISGILPWPVNSYTDAVDRVGDPGFYRIDVRLRTD